MTSLEFSKGMKVLSDNYRTKFTTDTMNVWYDILKDIPYKTYLKAIEKIILTSKYVPNASVIYEECRQINRKYLLSVADYMYKEGYFHQGIERLSDEHAIRNYEKTVMWLEKGIIPGFLKDDMKEYMKLYDNRIESSNTKQLTEFITEE